MARDHDALLHRSRKERPSSGAVHPPFLLSHNVTQRRTKLECQLSGFFGRCNIWPGGPARAPQFPHLTKALSASTLHTGAARQPPWVIHPSLTHFSRGAHVLHVRSGAVRIRTLCAPGQPADVHGAQLLARLARSSWSLLLCHSLLPSIVPSWVALRSVVRARSARSVGRAFGRQREVSVSLRTSAGTALQFRTQAPGSDFATLT